MAEHRPRLGARDDVAERARLSDEKRHRGSAADEERPGQVRGAELQRELALRVRIDQRALVRVNASAVRVRRRRLEGQWRRAVERDRTVVDRRDVVDRLVGEREREARATGQRQPLVEKNGRLEERGQLVVPVAEPRPRVPNRDTHAEAAEHGVASLEHDEPLCRDLRGLDTGARAERRVVDVREGRAGPERDPRVQRCGDGQGRSLKGAAARRSVVAPHVELEPERGAPRSAGPTQVLAVVMRRRRGGRDDEAPDEDGHRAEDAQTDHRRSLVASTGAAVHAAKRRRITLPGGISGASAGASGGGP